MNTCERCGAPLSAPRGKGRPARFCSATCRKANHRKGKPKRTGEAKECEHCGASFTGKGAYCSDRCYYYAHRDALPPGKEFLRAWDESLVPWVPAGQIAALEINRPDWHRWVYGGAVRA
jgi:hypothetical protein